VTSVRRKSNALAWRGQFECAFAEGRFQEAADLYDRAAGTSRDMATALKAAAARLHSDPAASLQLLIALRIPDANKRERVERDLLLAEAFARTQDFESADARLDTSLDTALKLKDKDLVASVGYRTVRRYLHAEDPRQARASLELTRRGQSRRSRLYALYAETLILPYEERVFEQAERLIELLRLLDPNTNEYVDVRAWSTHTLAVLARELYIPAAIPEIDRQLHGLPWPSDFVHNLFQALKGLAWAKALQGDYFNAFRHLKQASDVAGTIAWKVVAACDRSYLARCFDEHRWSRVELDEGEQLAARVDWHATLAEERIGLLLLAELFGKVDTARSAMYLARYRDLGEIRSPLYYRRDARRAAYAKHSTGVVELALGNKKRGLAELREARQIFERFGYDFRVARCLTDELEATGNKDLLPAIEERLRHYRQSWLIRELRDAIEQPRVPLPPMQRRVFEEICEGKSTAEIARSLGRSEYTISNHAKAIFKAFDVKSRPALLAEAVRRGYLKSGPHG
jgi:DNA-binding CsgD family transcriptional regulator/tetratricopeptide (TPR) repeat protein